MSPVHHHADADIIQLATEMTDIIDETTLEVNSEDETTGMADHAEGMRIMVGAIETRRGRLIEDIVGETTDGRNMTNERETEKGTGTHIGTVQVVQGRLVVLHHLPGPCALGRLDLVHGPTLAQGLPLLWTDRSQTLHLQVFSQRLLTQ